MSTRYSVHRCVRNRAGEYQIEWEAPGENQRDELRQRQSQRQRQS
jgi:hypothetical protein